jgi:anti-sigma regulatory factor (Ser/Thr protein kinase)
MAPGSFRHEAQLYAGGDEFVALATEFLRPALAAGDPALVLVDEPKQAALRAALGPAVGDLSFADVRDVGRNPAHIIPLWRGFVDDHAVGAPLWGISEPFWSGRTSSETAECQQHESLLNVALSDAAALTLLCPIDTAMVGAETAATAVRRHPGIRAAGAWRPNVDYAGADPATLLAEPLPAAPLDAAAFAFTDVNLRALRAHVAGAATALGFGRERSDDVVLAVDEVATNSYRYGGGGGTLRTWESDVGLVCEVSDQGRFTDPLVGRRRPRTDQIGGRGLWIANQLCDLVQVRSSDDGSVVRLHTRAPA